MFAPHIAFQAQIGALSAFLKNCGYAVRYLEIIVSTYGSFEKHKELVDKEIRDFSPDLVGFSSYDMNYGFIVDCARFLKTRYPGPKIIVGGHHASLAPEDYLMFESIDYVCIGEGEHLLQEILESSFDPEKTAAVKGLCFRTSDGKIVHNRPREWMTDLDTLPFVDRTIDTSTKDSGQLYGDHLPMLAGKGCPFNCSYCSNESMKRLYPNSRHYVRMRTPERIIEEIEYCKKTYKFSFIIFLDDIFALDAKWLERFCDLYARHFPKIPFHCLLRPEMALNERLLDVLYRAGCRNIKIGVECGSQEYRQKMLKRKMTNKTILTAASLIKRRKMELHIFMMVGLPDESALDMLKTLWLNLRIRADAVQTAIYYPLKNTPLYNYCAERNLLNEERRKKLIVYSYDTCLNHSFLRRFLIILFKWLNSSTPVFCRFHFSYIWLFLRLQYKKWFQKKIEYV